MLTMRRLVTLGAIVLLSTGAVFATSEYEKPKKDWQHDDKGYKPPHTFTETKVITVTDSVFTQPAYTAPVATVVPSPEQAASTVVVTNTVVNSQSPTVISGSEHHIVDYRSLTGIIAVGLAYTLYGCF